MTSTQERSPAPTSEDASPAVRIEGLQVRRGGFSLDVDLVVPRGHVSGLVGPNGAGKSTTIRALLGMVPADAGRVLVLGRDVGPGSDVVARVGAVLDRPTLAPEWRAARAGSRVGALYGRAWDEERFRDLLARFDVPPAVRVGDLSRGQQVKLSTAMALAHSPELLVLDEPTSGLDPGARAEFGDVVREYMAEGERSVLFSTHITSDLDDLADHLHVLSAGRVVHSGPMEELGEEFAMARGAGRPDGRLASVLVRPRLRAHGFDALVRVADSAALGADVLLEPATTDEVVAHLAGSESRQAVVAP